LETHPQHMTSGYWANGSETLVHFHKSFGVMQELFDHRDFTTFSVDLLRCACDATPHGIVPEPRFLDLGCAPGGFSACLLQDSILGPNSVGFGVSLPPHLGGFQMAFASDRLVVQMEDILGLQSVDLLAANNSIDLCVADAQYLKNMSRERCEKIQYRGLHVKSRALGIWALTVKECQLAFAKLRHNGSFIFRFGWRGIASADLHPTGEQVHPSLLAKYLEEEEWYKALTHWLFSVLKSLFKMLRPFKSEYVHQADVSFYMVCRSFDRKKYELHNWEAKLQRAFDELSGCEDEAALVAGVKDGISDEIKAEIDELLEVVGKMRAIGIESRKVTNPDKFKVRYTQLSGQKTDGFEPDLASSDTENNIAASAVGPAKVGTQPLLSDASTAAEDGGTSASSTPQTSDMDRKDAHPEVQNSQMLDGEIAMGCQSDRSGSISSGGGKGVRWKPVKPGNGPRGARHGPDPSRKRKTQQWIGVANGSDFNIQVAGVSGASVPWSASHIESIAEVSCMDDVEAENAYSRQMHVSRFQSQLQEWQQFKDACRSQEQEHTAAENVKRALHVQTFHNQLQQQQQQQQQQQWHMSEGKDTQVILMEQQLQCFDHMPANSAGVGSIAQHFGKSLGWITDMAPSEAGTGAYAWMTHGQTQCSESPVMQAEVTPVAVQPQLHWTLADGQPWLTYPLSLSALSEPVAQFSDDITPAVSSSVPIGDNVKAASAKQVARQRKAIETDSMASSDDDGRDPQRKVYRHKKRAGRVVRERRMDRRRRNGSSLIQSLLHNKGGHQDEGLGAWQRIKVIIIDCLAELNRAKFHVHAMRFGLFCAMAWSMNSILCSASRFSPR